MFSINVFLLNLSVYCEADINYVLDLFMWSQCNFLNSKKDKKKKRKKRVQCVISLQLCLPVLYTVSLQA